MNNKDLHDETVEELFNNWVPRGPDRRMVPRAERRHIKPDWVAVTIWACSGALGACVLGYLL